MESAGGTERLSGRSGGEGCTRRTHGCRMTGARQIAIATVAELTARGSVPLEKADALVDAYATRLDALFAANPEAVFDEATIAAMHRLLSEAIADVCG